MKGCQCIPPSPCLPCILGSFKLGYVGGWKDCYAEADASNHLAFIDTPLPKKSPVFILSVYQFPFALVALVLSARRPLSSRPYYIFFIFCVFPKILESACAMALPRLTLHKLREISISRNYFCPIACNAVVSGLCGFSSITWKCASIALIACGFSGGGSTMMVIGCGSLHVPFALAEFHGNQGQIWRKIWLLPGFLP